MMQNQKKVKKEEVKQEFGPHPDTDSPDFDFKREIDRLPFPLNMGDAPLTLEQQKCLHKFNL